MTHEDIFYAQEHDATDWVDSITEHGPEQALEDLVRMRHDPGNHPVKDDGFVPAESRRYETYSKDGFTLFWNRGLPEVGLVFDVDYDPFMEPSPEVGATLNNGATVLQSHKVERTLSIVLCLFEGQFVTWFYNHETGGAGNGHYHGQDLGRAVEEYNGRVQDCDWSLA